MYSDLTIGQGVRKYDITCCDIEPAVLARNILLFSLLDRNEDLDLVWNIFYHFKINDQALQVITRESQTLYEYSQNIETWRDSLCGSYLKMVDTRTLSELRLYWGKYATFESLPREQKSEFLEQQALSSAIMTAKLEGALVQSPSRSAGMLWPQALRPLTDLFRNYWRTGTTFSRPEDIRGATNLNPTFVYSMSGEEFLPNEGTFPQGFHFICAFAPLKSDATESAPNQGSAIDGSKQQFRAWCNSFRATKKAENLTIRFFAGDALAFCRALDSLQLTGKSVTKIFVTNYQAAQIDLNEHTTAPTRFDVIDTSNLIDHIGLLNLLIVTHSLLKATPTSYPVLYTEALLPFGKDPIKSFPEQIYTDIPTIALLLGLAPRAYASNFTAQSNIHELLFAMHRDQYHERTTWCNPSHGDNGASNQRIMPSFTAETLARIMFGIYDQMFANEKRSNLELTTTRTIDEKRSLSIVTYTRESFALLFRAVQRRVHLSEGTWEDTATKFFDMCLTDRERVDERFQFEDDLRLQFHLYGIFTSSSLTEDWSAGPGLRNSPRLGLFADWKAIPPVVCVVLTVPHERIAAISQDISSVGSPAFRCSVRGDNSGHRYPIYSATQWMWGKCLKSPCSNQIVVEEDSSGIRGQSDLIVSFWASSRFLECPGTQIYLILSKTFATRQLSSKFGESLEVFGASVLDEAHVQVLSYRPTLASEAPQSPGYDQGLSKHSPPSESLCRGIITQASSYHVDMLSVRLDVRSKTEQDTFINGASISATQLSACTMKLIIGDYTHIIHYPYPVHGQKKKLREERKLHYVEILVPVSKPEVDQVGYYPNPFPILRDSQGAYTTWNLHHLRLDRVPTLNLEDPAKNAWLGILVNLQLTEYERYLRDSPSAKPQGPVSPLFKLKNLISTMVALYSGIQLPRVNAFGLADESGKNMYTFLLIGGIKLDPASFTIALDIAVVSMSSTRLTILQDRSRKLRDLNRHAWIGMTREDTFIWKQALPAFVERCRTWEHREDCGYHANGIIPLSTELMENPICTCGEGIGFTSPRWNIPEWNELLPFATRAAICPLFPVSYLAHIAANVQFDDKTCWGFDARVLVIALPSVNANTGRSIKRIAGLFEGYLSPLATE